MKLNFKKALLAGTAIAAVSTFGIQAHAAGSVNFTTTPTFSGSNTGDNGVNDNTTPTGGVDGGVYESNNLDVVNSGTLTGGNGGTNTGADAGDGAFGGPGVTTNNGSVHTGLTFNNQTAGIITGGTGGNGDTFTTGAAGNGGSGGFGVYSDSVAFSLTNSGTIHGGNGGLGGAGTSTFAGGVGGDAGDGIYLGATGNIVVSSGVVTGGTGGAGGAGDAGSAATGGVGGIGGAGIAAAADGASITVSGNTTGGNGGAGGASDHAGSTGGHGGMGGGAVELNSNNDILHVNGAITLLGGNGGAGGASAGGTAGIGGDGDAGILITGTGATIVNNGATIKGGIGGTGAAAGTDGPGVYVAGAGASLTNTAGTIVGGNSGNGEGITIDADMTLLSNAGTIGSTTAQIGAAIDVGATRTLASFVNTGTIAGSTGPGISDLGKITVFNNAGGTIQSGGTGDAAAALIFDSTTQTALTINGTIKNVNATDNGVAISFLATPGASAAITNAGTITAAGTGTVSGIAIDFGADGSVINNASGTINGRIQDNGAHAVILSNAGTINGAITLNEAGNHTLTSTAGTINGAVTLTGAGTNTLNLAGGQIVGLTTLGTATLHVTGNYTTGGGITAAAATTTVDADKTFTINNTVNLGTGAITDTGTITVGSAGVLSTSGAVGVTGVLNIANDSSVGALTDNGTVSIAAGKALTAASYVGGSNGTLAIQLDNDAGTLGAGKLITTGSFVGTTTHLAVSIAAGSDPLLDGSTATIVHGTAAATNFDQANITDDSYLYDYSTTVDGNDIVLAVAQTQSLADSTTSTNNAAVAQVLLVSLSGSSDANIIAIQNNLASASTREEVNNDLEATQPTVDGGNLVASIGTTSSTFDVTETRLADARTGTESGMAAGNTANGLKVWAQGFGTHSKQDERDGIDGYSANTYGGAVGIDTANILDDAVLGLDLGYGHSKVSSKDANSTDTDIDSYQLTLYGTKKFNDFFIDGMAAYAFDRNDTTRHDIGGVAGLTADGSYNANQYAARLDAGQDFAFHGMTLTPTVGADYVYYSAQTYTETGAGGAGLVVDQDNYNQLNLGVALKAGWAFKAADGSWLKPDVHAGYSYDVLSDDVDASSTFVAGGPAFATSGLKPGRNTFDAGADIKYVATTNWEFSASYDFTAKEDYTANSGVIRAAYKF